MNSRDSKTEKGGGTLSTSTIREKKKELFWGEN